MTKPLSPRRKPNRQNNPAFSPASASGGRAPFDPGEPRHEAVLAEMVRNVPPHSLDAEKAVLGAVFFKPSAIDSVSDLLKEDDFYLPAHRALYAAFYSLSAKNVPPDLVATGQYLLDNGKMEEAGGAAYLTALAEGAISAANVEHYANIVRDKAQLRGLINACSGIIESCFETGRETKDILDESEQAVLGVAEERSGRTYKSSEELALKVFDDLDRRNKNRDATTGVNTGYQKLNEMTAGLQPSDLIIVAARPSMGKTALVLNMALRSAVQHGTSVAIFSLEMSMDQLMTRMLCCQGGVDLGRVRRNFIQDEDWISLQRAAGDLSSANIFIDDTPALSTMDLRARARRLKREKGLDLIIVDYLQLMRSSLRVDSRELEISDISRNLKALAKELNVPVVALSQLNRKVEERADKRPMLSDLRESGAIEQDADVIMFIYREAAYLKAEERPATDRAEIIIGKQRNGPVGMVPLLYTPSFTRFDDWVGAPSGPYDGI